MDVVRLIWSLSGSGLGTTIAGAGNSGAWSSASLNSETLLDLRWVDDLLITAYAGSITSTPSMAVWLDFYDDLGNLIPKQVTVPPVIAATTPQTISAGRHGPATQYLVFPAWGRIQWTCTGGTTVGTEIAVYGR